MRFATWEPVYRAVLDDFGYAEADDERARDVLAGLVTGGGRPSTFDVAELGRLDGATVAICGAAPSLADELDLARGADAVVAASAAADVCLDAGVGVDLMVTDLDKNPDTARALTADGAPVAVHAHGDNVPALREHVPTYATECVLPTTQARPADAVANFGGFTDGDRAAFLADHVGAGELVFPGWDFDDPAVSPTKRRKLAWGERLLYWLERRRGDRFAVLDGRREGVDASPLPING